MIAAPRFLVTLLPQYQSQLFPTFVLVLSYIFCMYFLTFPLNYHFHNPIIFINLFVHCLKVLYRFISVTFTAIVAAVVRFVNTIWSPCFMSWRFLSYKRTSYTFFPDWIDWKGLLYNPISYLIHSTPIYLFYLLTLVTLLHLAYNIPRLFLDWERRLKNHVIFKSKPEYSKYDIGDYTYSKVGPTIFLGMMKRN